LFMIVSVLWWVLGEDHEANPRVCLPAFYWD
jgi:hypothetical protein